ncbi:MAG: hypothetical protein OXC46_00860 [Thaumarchaeota archaeon]|nr:hypothetical protein [Nitrososphaerota archaeon]
MKIGQSEIRNLKKILWRSNTGLTCSQSGNTVRVQKVQKITSENIMDLDYLNWNIHEFSHTPDGIDIFFTYRSYDD